jgi:hypothetical protein
MLGVFQMKLWSLSTTIRNPQRLRPHLMAFNEVNDDNGWDADKVEEFFIKMIQLKVTTPRIKNLSPELLAKMNDGNYRLTWDEAEAIYNSKKFKGIPARVKSVLRHLILWGLITHERHLLIEDTYKVTEAGRALLYGELSLQKHLMDMLPLWKFPTVDDGFTLANSPTIRPYIATLALIVEVNRICGENGMEAVGIYANEFDLYALSITNPNQIHEAARQIVAFRKVMESNLSDKEKDCVYESEKDRIAAGFDGANSAFDYTDGIFRFFRISEHFTFPKGLEIINVNFDFIDEIMKLTRLYRSFSSAAEAKKGRAVPVSQSEAG